MLLSQVKSDACVAVGSIIFTYVKYSEITEYIHVVRKWGLTILKITKVFFTRLILIFRNAQMAKFRPSSNPVD
jgi:hypothetical protein